MIPILFRPAARAFTKPLPASLLAMIAAFQEEQGRPITQLELLKRTNRPPASLEADLQTLAEEKLICVEGAKDRWYHRMLPPNEKAEPSSTPQILHAFYHNAVLKADGDPNAQPPPELLEKLAKNTKTAHRGIAPTNRMPPEKTCTPQPFRLPGFCANALA